MARRCLIEVLELRSTANILGLMAGLSTYFSLAYGSLSQ